jgi:hypothetical protein
MTKRHAIVFYTLPKYKININNFIISLFVTEVICRISNTYKYIGFLHDDK